MRQHVKALTRCRVRDLVVVLHEVHEGGRREIQAWRAPVLALVGVELSLEQVAVLGRRDELLRAALVVSVVGLVAAGQHD